MEYSVKSHYKKLAPNYNRFWNYSTSHKIEISKKVIELLSLTKEDRFADIGCGTGLFTDQITKSVQFIHRPLCIEPCHELLEQLNESDRFQKIPLSAEDFVKSADGLYNKVLLKEVVQHISPVYEIFKSFFNRLPSHGRVLIVKYVFSDDFPLFKQAKDLDSQQEMKAEYLISILNEAGFKVVDEWIKLRVRLDKEIFFSMIRGRYLSFLSRISDDDIERGIQELNQFYHEEELDFYDHFQFILATK